MKWSDLNENGQAFFVYDLDQIVENARILRSVFSGLHSDTRLFFSLKSNPHIPIVQTMLDIVDGFDVSSYAELEYCRRLKIPGDRISMSGPGKTDAALDLAAEMNIGTVHIDSSEEFYRALRAGCKSMSTRMYQNDLFSPKLGVNEEEHIAMLTNSDQRAMGLHAYLGRETFSWSRLQKTCEHMAAWIERTPTLYSENPRYFIGPGVGADCAQLAVAPYKIDRPVDLEIGRALVANAGVYAAQVLSVKEVGRGARQAIVNGGLQHLGSPFVSLNRPLGTSGAIAIRDGHPLVGDTGEFMVAGSLCLGHDILHPRITVSSLLRRGDWLVFPRAGAYGITAGVPFFIGQELPREFVLRSQVMSETTHANFKVYHDYFGEIR